MMRNKNALESCPLCGGEITTFRGSTEVMIGARQIVVRDAHERCTECGEGFYGPGQLERLERDAASQIRAREGLLTPDQIRAIRERLGLSQAAFEQLLGVGPKTVVRWERGTVFQNRSTDALIRVVDAVPGVVPFLDALRNSARAHGAHGAHGWSAPSGRTSPGLGTEGE
ncbi:MAG: type II toxin-antitoxin system MqsA family antitoxin [Gemmatimonadales bacterium]